MPHLDFSKPGKSGYSGNSRKSGDSCESGMLAILVIFRNLAMFLFNWEFMVIMRDLSNFSDSGEPDGSGDSGVSSDFGYSPSSDGSGEIGGSVDAYEYGNSGSSVYSGNSVEFCKYSESGYFGDS